MKGVIEMITKKTITLTILSLVLTSSASVLYAADKPTKPTVLITNNRGVDFDWEAGSAATAVKWSVAIEGVVMCKIKGSMNFTEVKLGFNTASHNGQASDTKLRLQWSDIIGAIKVAAAKALGVKPEDIDRPEFKGTARVMGQDPGSNSSQNSEFSDPSEPFTIPD
jgi:hypothetical protein